MRPNIIATMRLGAVLFIGFLISCTKSAVQPSKKATTSNTDTTVVHQQGWQQVASLPSPRAYATAFTLNDNGYIAGGISDIGDPYAPGYDDMYMYNASANQWVKKAGMPALDNVRGGRRYPFTFMINNTIYGGGGLSLNGITGNDINAYDPVTDQWNLILKMNAMYVFDRSVGANSGNKGFIFSFPQAYENVYEFDPIAKTVKQAPFVVHMPIELWSPNFWYGTNDTNLIYGGGSGSADVAILDTAQYKMNNLPTLQSADQYPTQATVLLKGVYYNGCIYSAFGNAGNLYRFNLKTYICDKLVSQDLGVTQGAFAFVAGGKFYIAGGNNGMFTPSTNKVWMIDLDAYP